MAITLRCLTCDLPFGDDVAPVPIDTIPGRGLVAWCVWCEPFLNLGERKSCITAIIDGWRDGPIIQDYDAIQLAAFRFVEGRYAQFPNTDLHP